MATIDLLADEYEESDYKPPVGSIGYAEMDQDSEGRGEIVRRESEEEVGPPAWRTCPRGITSKDGKGRTFVVTEKVLWMERKDHSSYWGVSPLMFWKRYRDRDFPINLWLPGNNHDHPISDDEVKGFWRFLTGEGEERLVLNDLLFQHPTDLPEGVVYLPDGEKATGVTNTSKEEELVSVINKKAQREDKFPPQF